MPYRTIVIGVDGSQTATRALRSAAELAKTQGAGLVIVSCYQPPSEREVARLRKRAPQGADVSPRAAVEAVLSQAAEVADDVGVAANVKVAEGEPAEALMRVAEEEGADLIIVGNKGMTGARRFVLGSVPNRISHHMPCDLLITRTTGG